MTDNDNHPSNANAAKRLARLVAVQVLYQASYEQEALAAIVKHSLDEADAVLNGEGGEGAIITERPDAELLSRIVQGVTKDKEILEGLLAGALDAKFSSARMEVLLRSILLAGVYELHSHGEIASSIIISDYVDVARAFFQAKEPGLVNAVLDKLAKTLRG